MKATIDDPAEHDARPDGPGDGDLVAAAQAGSREDFAALVERYQDQVFSTVFAVTGSVRHSDEMAHDAFVIAWEKLPRLQRPEVFASWLCGIARNVGRRFNRQRHHDRSGRFTSLESGRQLASAEPSALERVISDEEEHALAQALGTLPEGYRLPFILVHRDEQSIQAVARALDLSPGNVRQRLFRARRMLAEQMAFIEATLPRVRVRKGLVAGVMAVILPGARDVSAQVTETPGLARSRRIIRWPKAIVFTVTLGSLACLALVRSPGRKPLGAAGRSSGVADLASVSGGQAPPSFLPPEPSAAAGSAAAGATEVTASLSLLTFDFEDGDLPSLLEFGDVIQSPPGWSSRFCARGTLNLRFPRETHLLLGNLSSSLFVYSDELVISFDYWVGDDFPRHLGIVNAISRFYDGVDFADRGLKSPVSVQIWDMERAKNFHYFLFDYVLDKWGHAEVPLSAFLDKSDRSRPQAGDRISQVGLTAGIPYSKKPFLVDNIVLAYRRVAPAQD